MDMFAHQKEAVEFLRKRDFCGLLACDIGTGKTRIGIEAFKELRKSVPAKLLVVCPLSLIESAWIEDINKFAPDLTYVNLRKSKAKDELVRLINFETFATKRFQEKWDFFGDWMIIIDESSKIKSHSANITKTILASRKFFNWRICMSATPAPNIEMEWWSQIEFVAPGVLHPAFHGFKNTYFHLARGKYSIPQGGILGKQELAKMFAQGWAYAITDQKRQKLMKEISPVIFRADKDKCLDLPDTLDEIRKVQMGPSQRRHYNQMKNDLITQIKSEAIVAQVALTKIMKLRQICSGAAITPDSSVVAIGENPKLSELEAIIEEAGGEQVIVWAQFHFEIEEITKALGPQARSLYAPTVDKDGVIKSFKEGGFRYLVAHPRSAGHGHTFINCAIQVFYSLDYSWETYEQARGRVHRAGQSRKVTYIHILCQDSIEEVMLKCLQRKASDFDFLMECL